MSYVKLLKLKHVMDKTTLSRSTICNKLDKDSPLWDPDFPQPIRIGARSIVWVESEVDEWIEKCVSNRKAKAGKDKVFSHAEHVRR